MRRTSVGITGVVLAALAGRAIGQVEPSSSPEPPTPSLEPNEAEREAVRDAFPDAESDLTTPTVEPTRTPTSDAVQPGVGVEPRDLPALTRRDELGRPVLMRERTFLVKERATLLRAATGEWVAAFHGGLDPSSDDPRDAPPPMVLLPSPTLENLELTARGRGLDVAYRLSGETTQYHGRNYLMLTAFGVESIETASPTPAEGEVIDLGSAPTPARVEIDDPSVDALIADLAARRNVASGLTRPSAAATPNIEEDGEINAASGVLPALVRDGDLLVRRRGRLTRMAGGEWAFVVDHDTDRSSAALRETPLVLLPCRALMRMERAVRDAGDAMSFELTGRLTSYAGRVYVLPTLAVRMPEDRGGLTVAQ